MLVLQGCGGQSLPSHPTADISGFVHTIFASELPTSITVAVAGRDDLKVNADLSAITAEQTFPFTLTAVPLGESLVFKVEGAPLQSSVSVPTTPGSGTPVQLGLIGSNNFTKLKEAAEAQANFTINPARGTIVGVVSPAQRVNVTQVSLLQGTVTAGGFKGPFYFKPNSNSQFGFELATVFSPANGIYAFFNVPPGNYTLTFNGPGGLAGANDVAVAADTLSIAQDIP